MNTSEVLDLAADHVEERGWHQGPSGWPRMDGRPAGLCLEGGIMAALGQTFEDADLAEFATCPAYRAVQSYLGLSHELTMTGFGDQPVPVEPLWGWNDEIGRTKPEVVEVLRAAAMVERAREAAEQRLAAVSS